MKIDVALQSYKKPESLLYTLMSLKKYSGKYINNIYINDDSDVSFEELKLIFLNDKVKEYFAPSKIILKQNSKRVGFWPCHVIGYWPKGISPFRMFYILLKCLVYNKSILVKREDVRYQYAIDNADTEYVYIIHDDVIFHGDILGEYIKVLEKEKYDVIGDLGQCWRCSYNSFCTPEKVVNKIYPSKEFPMAKKNNKKGLSRIPCRINEWSCLLKVSTERKIIDKYQIFFGNYEADEDIGCYWFKMMIKDGYNFFDPLPTKELRNKFYTHGWNGHSGHSVWVNQGKGKSLYDPQEIKEKMMKDFGVMLI